MKDLRRTLWRAMHWPTKTGRGETTYAVFAAPHAPQYLAVQPVFLLPTPLEARRRRPRPKVTEIPTPPRPQSAG